MKIAFMGISGSGKDYLADILVRKHGFIRLSFSDQLKNIAHMIYPWMQRDYEAIEKEKKMNITLTTGEVINKSPREIWLHLNSLRDIENLIFIRMLEDEYNKLAKNKSMVITDIRSTDEFNWCAINKFKIIYINPIKQIYKNYKIDDAIENNKQKANFEFKNEFDGTEKFEHFFKKYLS